MLIINADDLGRSVLATDRTMSCFRNARLTSASAMVFMDDSERAASLARDSSLDVGLHLNFTEAFQRAPKTIAVQQTQVRDFLGRSKYSFLLYSRKLRAQFRDLVRAQSEEFQRLYHKAPSHFDGHHHMHLCTNMLLDQPVPPGSRMRGSFSFERGEKSWLNRFYRGVADWRLGVRYTSPQYLYSFSTSLSMKSLEAVVTRSRFFSVELQTHPENIAEFDWLMSERWGEMISTTALGTFAALRE